MPVRRGEAWGEPGRLPDDAVVVGSDAEAREVVSTHRREGRPPPPIGLLGGDLCRTLGGMGDADRLQSSDAVRFPVDLGEVLVDGVHHWFVAHLVARSRDWRHTMLAMNAQFLREWDVAPRAHPGDGRLDVLEADLQFADLWKVRRRLPAGAHLPHPRIRTSRAVAAQFEFDRPRRLYLDGTAVGTARRLSVRIQPDILTVVV